MKYPLSAVALAVCELAYGVDPSTVDVKAASGVTVKVTPRKGNTSTTIPVTVNLQDKVMQNGVQVYPKPPSGPPPQCDTHGLPVGCTVPPPPIMASGLQLDLSRLLPPNPGTLELKVIPTTEVAPLANGKPGYSGAFRAVCLADKVKNDDPIVNPGKPGVAHAHTFACNTSTDAFSTLASLLAGPSNGRGGSANTSAYWVPSLADMRTMRPRLPDGWTTYYKGGVFDRQDYGWAGADNVWHSALKPDGTKKFPGFTELPNGLKMIAGDSMRKVPRTNSDEFSYRWQCIANGVNTYSGSIPACSIGGILYQEIFFPQCWDGVNLDSPNHKSHMAFPIVVKNAGDSRGWSHNECPATHPVVLPQISYQIHWNMTEVDQSKYYRLSSDSDLTAPPGVTAHGDVFVAWKPEIKKAWHSKCVVGDNGDGKDCHSHLTGDGRQLVGPP